MENHVILILLLVIGNIARSCHAIPLDETHDSFDEIIEILEKTDVPKQINHNSEFCTTPECVSEETHDSFDEIIEMLGKTDVPKQINHNSEFCTMPECVSEEISKQTRYEDEKPHIIINGQEVCMTPECILTASSIIKNMDSSVKPCDDFYSFACGNFVKNTEIPEDQSFFNNIVEVWNTVHSNLRKVLETKNEKDLKTFKNLKNYYDVCMNEDLIEKQGNEPLLKVLNELGGWPVLLGDKWDENSFNWYDAMVKNCQLGFPHNSFVSIDIGTDARNSSQFIIEMDQPSLELSREYLKAGMKDRVLPAYLRYMMEIATILGANIYEVITDLTEMIRFEMKLSYITPPEEERRSGLSYLMTVRQLNEKFPTVPWKDFLNKLLAPIEKLSDDDVINVASPNFIVQLLKLLDRTPKRVQANYAMWGVILNSIQYSTKNIRKAELKYSSLFDGHIEDVPRWKDCTFAASTYMSLATGALYARNFLHEDVKRHAVEMVSNIRDTIKQILKKVDWMDDQTKGKALQKVEAMVAHIAYPDELLDDHKIEQYHADLTIYPNNYLEVALNVSRFRTAHKIKRLRKPVNKTDWVDHGAVAVVNSFYSPSENSIQFPAAILQGAFFNDARPKYMNYGGIGSVIAHEITHGFDDRGRSFDKDGNFADWWDPSTNLEYLVKAQCIIEQYSNFTEKNVGLNIDGFNTQGENIADNGGIKAAYMAYNEWVNRNGAERQLPGLNYTAQQMFWISNANIWCVKHRPEALRLRVFTDSHSPGEFRVNGPLSNRPEFAKDFGCPVGSKMNPENKCSVL